MNELDGHGREGGVVPRLRAAGRHDPSVPAHCAFDEQVARPSSAMGFSVQRT
jgi:hypothetical protein